MGNQPNNLIQCGMEDADTRQEVSKTTEEAVMASKGHHIFGTGPRVGDSTGANDKSGSSRVFVYSSGSKESRPAGVTRR